MDWQKVQVAIKKINALYKSMSMGEGDITSIERDLMLNYIRQLYEVFLVEEEGKGTISKSTSPGLERQKKPDFEIVDNEEERSLEKEEKTEPKKTAPPKIIEIPESLKDLETDAKEQPRQPDLESDPEPPVKKQNPPPPKAEPRKFQPDPMSREEQARPTPSKRPDLEVLFDFKQGSELADKLSDQPVEDLTKALSINDRLLYMNELFGKDMGELDESLKLMNRFESLQEAKSLIYNLAEQYNWTAEEKVDIAKDFIRLVRRRYL